MKYLLGVDNGGTVTKAALYTMEGREVAAAAAATQAIREKPGFVERDMEEMWRTNCQVIGKTLEKSGVSSEDVACMAVCGHGKGLYLWGKDGRPARNGIISTDNRAYAYPLKWKRDGTEEAIFSLTCQHILPSQPVSLLSWLKDNEPETLNNVRWVFACKDYLRFRLTGEARAELTDYSGANVVNLRRQCYDEKILGIFGLSQMKDAFAPLCRSTEICGRITGEAARLTGLKEGIPVAGGMFDIDACMIAARVTDEENICMIAGSWGVNLCLGRDPIMDGSILMNSLFALEPYYLIEESSPASAGNLNWFIQEMLPERKEQCCAAREDLYGQINAWVASLPAGEFCPIYLPFLTGSHAHANAKASFVGISGHHTRAHILRGLFEGVAFAHRHHLDRLMRARKTPPRAIRLTGGAAKSPVWAQMFADVMNLPVETLEADEMGTLGCAIAAAAAIGSYSGMAAAARGMSRVSARYLPVAPHHAAYEKKYALYEKTVGALEGIWPQIQTYIEQPGH